MVKFRGSAMTRHTPAWTNIGRAHGHVVTREARLCLATSHARLCCCTSVPHALLAHWTGDDRWTRLRPPLMPLADAAPLIAEVAGLPGYQAPFG